MLKTFLEIVIRTVTVEMPDAIKVKPLIHYPKRTLYCFPV